MKRALESRNLRGAKHMRGISKSPLDGVFVVHSEMDQLFSAEIFPCSDGRTAEEATATTDATLLVSNFSQ